ncbi:MAG TPA: MMPL family transporter [Candidatus Margulisiibacteriota bacterium]|nr:MMPL family transporter [Candidatus Margulisiibacteriota bacterium]
MQRYIERYIRFIVRHRVGVVLAVLVITGLLGTQLRKVHLEIRRRASLPQEHPYVRIQNRISDLFGGETLVVIGVVANTGDVFTPEILGKVYRITQGLRSTPGIIETSLFSLAAPYVKAVVAGADGTMDIHQLMDGPVTSKEDIEHLRHTVRNDKLYDGNLVSTDGTATVIVAEFDDRLNDVAIFDRIEEVVAPERDVSVSIALAGAPILRAWLTRYTALIRILFPIAVLVIGLIHYEAFRTMQAMFLPLVTALLSVVWALGIMGMLGQPMDTWSAITPVVILAVAAGHAVQILKRYYEEYAVVGDNEEAVIRSLTAVGPVMLTAGLIASAGFASLMSFGVTSVRVFGLLLASGILSALVIEMTFTPACRCLLPAPKGRETRRERESRWLNPALDALATLIVRRPRSVLLGAFLITALAAKGISYIDVDNSFRLWFAPSTVVRHDDALLNERLPGTASLRILVEGEHANVFQDPAVLKAMSDLEDFIESDPHVAGVNSIADQIKRMHQAMNNGDPAFYAIPDNARLISQYLLLYSIGAGPDGLSAFVDANYQRSVIRALSKTDSAAFSRDLLLHIQHYADRRFRGLPVSVEIAGGTLGVQTAMNDVVVHEKVVNMIQVGSIIFLLSALVLRSFVGGIFVLLPLALAVVVNLGVMGWSRTWLDMTTAAITAMGVSIGADFAIYLIFRIREEAKGMPLDAAIRASLHTSGKAILFVSSAVALGYMVLPFSGFSIWARLGVLTALIVSVSAFATLTVIPSLALLTEPRFLARAPVPADSGLRAPAVAVGQTG